MTRIFTQDQTLLMDLRLHLESEGFFFNIQAPDFNSGNAGGIVFAKPLYFDGISKDRVLEAVLGVVHTVRFIMLAVQRQITTHPERSSIPVYLR